MHEYIIRATVLLQSEHYCNLRPCKEWLGFSERGRRFRDPIGSRLSHQLANDDDVVVVVVEVVFDTIFFDYRAPVWACSNFAATFRSQTEAFLFISTSYAAWGIKVT